MEILLGRNPLPVFVSFFVCGIISGVFCDILRIKRRIFSEHAIFLFFDDLLFFMFCTVVIIFNAYCFNDGNMKWYEIPVMISGFVLYRKTVSVLFIGVCFRIIDFLRELICYITAPIHKILSHLITKVWRLLNRIKLRFWLIRKRKKFSGWRIE